MTDERKECKVIPFKSKEEQMAKIRFRHLSDHLFGNPCLECADKDSIFCKEECPTMIRKKITSNILENGKSF